MENIFIEGMLLQAGLIFALGPQNVFVLESGLKKRHHILVSFICFMCDFSLIIIGVMGAATFFNKFPQIKILIGFLGILFLIKSGYEKLIQKGFSPIVDDRLPGNDFHNVILSALSFSLINPHAYLDGIVLIGGYSARFPHLSERVFFGFGAAFFSLLWFLFLSIGSSLLVVFFNGKRSIRPIVNFSGVLLFIFSGKLTLEVVGWINEVYPEPLTSLVSLFKEYK